MPDFTIAFELLSLSDITAVNCTAEAVRFDRLSEALVVACTRSGRFAKFQVLVEDTGTLRITRLTVYAASGVIGTSATDLVVPLGGGCDLEGATIVPRGGDPGAADFVWQAILGPPFLEPRGPAIFAGYASPAQLTVDDLMAGDYDTRPVEGTALRNQLVYLLTDEGRYAALFLRADGALTVRRMVVFDPDGRLHLDRSNLEVPRNDALDADTGEIGEGRGDLWWREDADGAAWLAPMNGAAISFPSYFRRLKYQPALRSAAVRTAMLFEDERGLRSYDAWSTAEKELLHEYLYLRDTARELPITGPPPLTPDPLRPSFTFFSMDDAWKMYLAHVVQSLWVDASGLVPWRLLDAGAEHLGHLFDVRKLFEWWPPGYRCRDVTSWNPVFAFEFLKGTRMLRPDHWGTIQGVVDWCRTHLEHAGPPPQVVYGYDGPAPVERIIEPSSEGRHWTQGCWCTTEFLMAVLRTVNIPVRRSTSLLRHVAPHSRAEFFTVGRSLVHGDDPYDARIRLGHHNVPIDRIFYDDATLAARIDAPPLLPGLSRGATADTLHTRYLLGLAVEFRTEYLLNFRCEDRRNGRQGAEAIIWSILHDDLGLGEGEIRSVIADLDAAIAAIPGGCSDIRPV
jgi:hypothetical protein